MKIQISPIRIVPGVTTVWNESGPDVDIIFKDIKDLGFKPESIEEMYVFHVFEHLFSSEIPIALANYRSLMMKGGELYIVSDDYEFICRAFLGGEFNIDEFNVKFSYPTKISRDNLCRFIEGAGYSQHDMRFWYVDVPNLFKKKEFEIVVSSKKV